MQKPTKNTFYSKPKKRSTKWEIVNYFALKRQSFLFRRVRLLSHYTQKYSSFPSLFTSVNSGCSIPIVCKSNYINCNNRNPSLRILIAAFISRSCSVPQCGQTHFRICKSLTFGLRSPQQ